MFKKIAISLIIVGYFNMTAVLAEDQKKNEHAKDEHAKDSHDKDDHAKPLESAEAQKEYIITTKYTNKWLPFPTLSGKSIFGQEPRQFAPKKGFANVVVFISSWCLPCQKLMPQIRQMERTFQKLNARFLYVFSNDTIPDAQGFSKEYGIKDNAVVANQEILKTFHNPELPSIYIGDRHGWLLLRSLKTNEKEIAKINGLLERMTAF